MDSHLPASSNGPLNFSNAVAILCADIAARFEEFQHIRMEHVAVGYAQARRSCHHGLQAKLTPMRFKNGELTTRRFSKTWTVQRLYQGDREILYILTFYLPRFLDQTFRQKMVTVFHELYHISPLFNGDIRRMGGRYHVHSHDQKEYDRCMDAYVDRYLSLDPPPEVYDFLRHRFRSLEARHGGIFGLRIPNPKLIPVPDRKTA